MDNRRAKLTAVFAAVVAVIAVVALIATTYMNIGSDRGERTADPGPVNVEGELAPGGPLEESDPEDPSGDGHDQETQTPDAATEAAIQDVTVRFIDAWKTPGTAEQRTKQIGPLATEYLTRLLARVDPRELPTKGTVVGDPKLIAFVSYAAGVEVRLSTGERLRVNLVLDTSGWRANELLPVDTDTPPAEGEAEQQDKQGKQQGTDKGQTADQTAEDRSG